MSSDLEIFDLIDKAADRLGWVVWSLNLKEEDSLICERALNYLCIVLTHRMKGDTIMTNIGSYVLPDDEIIPTLEMALAYLEQAIEGIKENEGENPDYTDCRLAIPDIQEAIRLREIRRLPPDLGQVAETIMESPKN